MTPHSRERARDNGLVPRPLVSRFVLQGRCAFTLTPTVARLAVACQARTRDAGQSPVALLPYREAISSWAPAPEGSLIVVSDWWSLATGY